MNANIHHFNIKLEILANKTGKKEKEGKRRVFGGERGRECELVKGIPIRKEIKMSLFADDMKENSKQLLD